jgi:hypothetical protein
MPTFHPALYEHSISVLMTATIQQRSGASAWNQFCDWVTSTNNRLYVGFFRVRLWSRKELLEKLFTHYDQLPEDIRLALPLKRVWMVAQQDE